MARNASCRSARSLAQRLVVVDLAAEAHGQHRALGHQPLHDPFVDPERIGRRVAGGVRVTGEDGEQRVLADGVERCLGEPSPPRGRQVGASQIP